MNPDYKFIVDGATEILPNVYAHNGGKVKLGLDTRAGVWRTDWNPGTEFDLAPGDAVDVVCGVNHDALLKVAIVPTTTQGQDALGRALAKLVASNVTDTRALACLPFATTAELTALLAVADFAMRPGVDLAQETFDEIVGAIEARAGYVWKEVEE